MPFGKTVKTLGGTGFGGKNKDFSFACVKFDMPNRYSILKTQ